MSETKVKPGRKMKATHHVDGRDEPVSCDSVDNLLVLANRRIEQLEARTPDPRIEAAKGLADALKEVVSHGEPLRGDVELWSTWQTRVNAWKAAGSALAAWEQAQ